MKIAEATAHSGLSADTIRFYERQGLIDPIQRGGDGHRVFSARDLRWLRLFERLRATGMALADMKHYADLARQGDSTLSERRKMLQAHRTQLDTQQAKIDACRALIDEKITLYRGLERAAAP